MSKKKNKFKKNKKIKPVPNFNSQAKIGSMAASSEAVLTNNAIDNEVLENDQQTSVEEDHYKTDKYSYVSKDIKKIALLMGIILLILIGVYIIDIKSTILNSFGDWIYKLLNIYSA